MNWIFLFIAGVLEITWVVGLKYSDGFNFMQKPWPCVVVAVAITSSMLFLTLAIRALPLGTAYAVWTGMGIAGAAIFGILLFDEPANVLRIFCVFLIIAGIAGLKLTAA